MKSEKYYIIHGWYQGMEVQVLHLKAESEEEAKRLAAAYFSLTDVTANPEPPKWEE